MIETVEEGLKIYRSNLKEYLDWKGERYSSWDDRLCSMREVLSITDEENEQIITEIKGQ